MGPGVTRGERASSAATSRAATSMVTTIGSSCERGVGDNPRMPAMATPPPESAASDDAVAAMLAARYGTSRPRRRWPLVVSVSLSAASLIGVLFWAAATTTNPEIDGRLQSFSVVSDTRVDLRFLVRTRADVTEPGLCVLRAQDRQRIDVGYSLVTIEPTDGADALLTYPLTTRKAAHIVELLGCGLGDQIPRGVPEPQFPPGVRAPEQVAPGRAP